MIKTAFENMDLSELLNRLTLDEKISLLAGRDWWTTCPVKRLGIPSIKCSDGPNGVRGKSHYKPTPAIAVPCGTALGATFDLDLMLKVGGLLAEECSAKGASMLLGPTVNIQRNPKNGRAFESFSEDPYLSGMIASAYINGLQEQGVTACIKHFVANDMEHERSLVDVRVTERALREVYLMPFMIAQIRAKPGAFMTSYSRLNGTHVSENKTIIEELLRKEWKFQGLAVSDWYGTYSTTEAIKAGLDLEMPGATMWRGERVKYSVIAGKLSPTDIDKCCARVLNLVQDAVKRRPDIVARVSMPETISDDPALTKLNRKIAANSIVLLKNDQNVLPLNKNKIRSIAVIGPNARSRSVTGGGSAFLQSEHTVTALEGITAAVEGANIEAHHVPGCHAFKFLPMLDGWMKTTDGVKGWKASFYASEPSCGDSPISIDTLPSSRIRINDEKPLGVGDEYVLHLEALLEAPDDGDFDIGIAVAGGRGRILVDGKEVVDNGFKTRQVPGASFYGVGTQEEIGTLTMIKGQVYRLEVIFSSLKIEQDQDESSQPSLILAGLRVGCAPHLDTVQAIRKAVDLVKQTDAVVVVIGTNMDIEGEGGDRPHLDLPGATNQLVEAVLQERPDAIIVNQSGSAVILPWMERATTFVQSWFGGDEAGHALADVLFGMVNPSARMSMTFPHRIQDCTAHLNWGSEFGKVVYGEGIFVGYRGYQEKGSEVLFAFGQGMSYSTFAWSPVKCHFAQPSRAADLSCRATISVTNTSSIQGADVVQIYVSHLTASIRRPERELKGFAKTTIQSGETKDAIIELDKWAFAFYDEGQQCWKAEKGKYIVRACKSSRIEDQMSEFVIELAETWTWVGL